MESLSQEVALIGIACAFCVLVAIGIVILILAYQKKQLQYRIDRQQLQNEYNEAILKSRIEAQEETLNVISSEIHDHIGQILNSARFMVYAAARAPQQSQHVLEESAEVIGRAIEDLRLLSKSLNGQWLEKFSFIDNLKQEAQRLQRANAVTLHVQHDNTITITNDGQLILFRLLQEAIQNSIKHGKASTILVTINRIDSQYRIAVKDNGVGFDAEDQSRHGFGFMTMKHRIGLMHGQLQITSGSSGTELTLYVPVEENTTHLKR
jgi:signal transduction histidine kinase